MIPEVWLGGAISGCHNPFNVRMRLGIIVLGVCVAAPVAAQPPGPVADFGAQARLLYDVAACAAPAKAKRFRQRWVGRHCKRLNAKVAAYKGGWLKTARPFFANIVPANASNTIVYPFAGGDLLTALAVFPDMRELTTISMEPAGDPRAVDSLPLEQFRRSLASLRYGLLYLLRVGYSATVNLDQIMVMSRLPGQLIFSLVALKAHGYEPVSLRYFRFRANGSIAYVRKRELKRFGSMRKRARNKLFGNMELSFRKIGSVNTKPIVYRHVFANLANKHVPEGLLRHLRSKGRVAAMTKAASYLLWWSKFSRFRKYLLNHVDWMVSDASGILPMHARPAGFKQRTWGRFNGVILNIAKTLTADAKRLWKKQPYRKLPFRFGYPDSFGQPNLLVTYRNR